MRKAIAQRKGSPIQSRWAWDRLVPWGLSLLTLALFGRVITHDFVRYDDPLYVTENLLVQQGLTWDGLVQAFSQIHGHSTYWHPVTWISHMVDCQLFGLSPGFHHLGNLVLHIVNALLVYGLLRSLTGSVWRSALVAALFAWHPLQVDTVAWVAERKNVLSTLFMLLSLQAYVRYARQLGQGHYAATLFFFGLGLMSKPMLVTLPCLLLLLDYWPLQRVRFSGRFRSWNPNPAVASVLRCATVSPARILIEKLPCFAMSAVSSWITIVGHQQLDINRVVYHDPLLMRLENALVSYGLYLRRVFWPDDLAVLYPHPGEWPFPVVFSSALLLLVVTLLALWKGRRYPYLRVGWFWFLGVLMPTIGLVQVGVQAMADRFVYVPLIGLFWMLVWGCADYAQWLKAKPIWVRGASTAALVGCLAVSSWQLGFWKNSLRLFERALQVTSNNYVAHQNLAFELTAQGRFEQALHQARLAQQFAPTRGEPLGLIGVILETQGHLDQAIPYYQQSLRLQPNLPRVWRLLGLALTRSGNFGEAIPALKRALASFPTDAELHAGLGLALSNGPQIAEALEHYQRALKLNGQAPEVLNNLAWLRATHPKPEIRDGQEAVRLAEQACQLTGHKTAQYLGTLAAAYAETDQFNQAVETAEQARLLAQSAGETALAQANERLRELYRQHQAYRDTNAHF